MRGERAQHVDRRAGTTRHRKSGAAHGRAPRGGGDARPSRDRYQARAQPPGHPLRLSADGQRLNPRAFRPDPAALLHQSNLGHYNLEARRS